MRRTVMSLAAPLALAACATSRAETEATACPPNGNWQAWIDVAPGPRAQLGLFVDGEVTVPAGMVARIRAGALDKSLPPGQRFVLEVRRGRGPAGPQRVRGVARPAEPAYREVVVTCAAAAIARIEGSTIETAD